MADKELNEEADPTEAAPAKRPGIMALVKVVAIISVVVLLEVVGASMMMPSAAETAELAVKLAAADSAREVDADSTEEATNPAEAALPAEDMREVSLGAYHVLSYNPNSGSSLTVDFELYATVLAEEESEFYTLFDTNQRRIREQVLIAVRGLDVSDLTDAGLGLIKRKILEKTNRSLGKPLLREAIFSTFSFNER